ncbi:hypothetical protein SAMN06298216_2585 [Spirosomataceae bacterium TFI 002]|nr:hypothetical protein SAMN06298216_2585 [Spirosomataceae bacterium TFI 002]
MNHKIWKLLFSVFAAGLIYSCTPSDEVTPSFVYDLSSFSFNQNKYNLDKGFIINYGKDNPVNGNNINLNLISGGISIYDKSGIIDSARGFGHLLFFEMYSYSNTELLTGRYNFDHNYNRKPFTFDSGRGFLNMDLPDQSSQAFQISQGTMDVINTGQGNYEIKFDCKNYQGEQVKGAYKGKLKYYNYSY